MTIETLIPALLDGGSTVVLSFLLIWMIIKQPERMSKVFDSIISQNQSGLEQLTKTVENTNEALSNVLDKHLDSIKRIEDDMSGMAREIHKLAVLLYLHLSKPTVADRTEVETLLENVGPLDPREHGNK